MLEMEIGKPGESSLIFVQITLWLLLFNFRTQMATGMKTNQIENETKKGPIEQIEGVLGQRVEMPCDISVSRRDDAVYMVLWFSESHGKPLYSFDMRGRGMKTAKIWSSTAGFDRRADFQAASYPAHLLVSDLKIRDQGLYRCRVDFKNSRTRNSLVNLTVVVPPSPPIIYDGSDEEVVSTIGPLVEGSDVLLKCRVREGNPEPTVSWYVNGALIDSTSYVNGYGDVVNEFLFQQVNRSHLNSQFTCKAGNTRLVPPVERSVMLDLNLKPLFVRLRQKQTDRVLAGKEYRLGCETAGSKPPAELRWIKGGKEITQVITQELDGGNVTSSTFVFIPRPDDNGGSITCRAENPRLNRTQILEEVWNLNVVYPPEVKLSLGSTLNPHEIKEGTDVYFECKIQANPKVTKLVWLLNGEELKHNIGGGIIMSNQSLVLQGINRNQNGNYCCIATNLEGSSYSNELPLSVMYTPVCIAKNGVTVGATKGESVGLRCAVESNPTAFRFEWEFHGTSDSLDIVALGKTVSLGDLSRFFYTPQTELEFGTFLCWGSNAIGRQVQPCLFHVVAAVKPHPLENCSVVNQTGTTIQVECSSHREFPSIPDQPLFRIMNGIGEDGNESPAHQDPAEYGLFPEYYICEVWDIKNRSIRRNLSSETPVFILKGLGPGAWLRFILYAANSHGKSEPVLIEAHVGGDAERQALGERRSQMEFYPVVAIGVGIAVTGTLFILAFAVMLRSKRFCGTTSTSSPILQTNGTMSTNFEKSRQASSLISSPQAHLTTTSPNNSVLIGSGGYRALPQSKSEADTNPDIIPGANNYPTDYEEELERSLMQKGLYLNSATHRQPSSEVYQPHSRGHQPTSSSPYSDASLDRRGSFQTVHYNTATQSPYQGHPKPPNCYPRSPQEFHPHNSPTRPSDYNTIYIREKLFLDSDIPESCV